MRLVARISLQEDRVSAGSSARRVVAYWLGTVRVVWMWPKANNCTLLQTVCLSVITEGCIYIHSPHTANISLVLHFPTTYRTMVSLNGGFTMLQCLWRFFLLRVSKSIQITWVWIGFLNWNISHQGPNNNMVLWARDLNQGNID